MAFTVIKLEGVGVQCVPFSVYNAFQNRTTTLVSNTMSVRGCG